jgi:diguanylate cyclase (GGDEF)-like protein/PAS domain S-box-containing protein
MPIRNESHAAKVIHRIAAVVATLVALSLPIGHVFTALASNSAQLEFKAKVKASALNGLIASNPDVWMLAENRLMGLIASEPVPLANEVVEVIDAEGNVVVKSGAAIDGPILSRNYTLYDAGIAVGRVKVSGSQRSVVNTTLIALFLGIVLGSMVFVVMRVLPMRALRRTTEALVVEKVRAEGMLIDLSVYRDHLENLVEQRTADLRIAAAAFDSQEAMFVTDVNRKFLRINKAFTQSTGYDESESIGQTIDLLKSDRHDDNFYQSLWESVDRFGGWQGEIWNRRATGDIFPSWMTITALKNEDRVVTNFIGVHHDITERKLAEDEIHSLAFFDHLTGLPNRRQLMARLDRATATSCRSKKYGALLFIDLDNFKTLNDTRGHDIGDLLLQQVATRLTSCVREGDTVARLGGDEFVVLLEQLSVHKEEAVMQSELVGEKVLSSLNKPYKFDKFEHTSTASIGITLFVDDPTSTDDILKRADLAMYQAKAAGRNTLRFFDPEMQAVVAMRAALEIGLRDALLHEQLLLYYQAQVDAKGQITGAEVLLRWQSPDQGLILPAGFIAFAEESGLIVPMGQWVLRTACAQLACWAANVELAHLSISVNVSVRQLKSANFVPEVLAVIEQSGIDPTRLKLELTESLILDNVEQVILKMTQLKDLGVRFSLDDFGTGYSSLSYLKRLPLYQLKIDQSFVCDILTDPNDAAIAQMVIALATALDLAVIAEGVETQEQRDFLASQGCHAYQGYLYGHPLPIAEFENLIKGSEIAAETRMASC